MVVELSLTLADLPNQKLVMDEPKPNVTAAEWLHCSVNVRVTPLIETTWRPNECPLSATSRLMRRSN
jgi:hypothetical protein